MNGPSLVAVSVVVLSLAPASDIAAQFVTCPAAGSQDLIALPEFRSSGGVLRGTINLTEAFQRLPTGDPGAQNCPGDLMRIFKGEGLAVPSPASPVVAGYSDPLPGPTLRARVGDLVQLSLVNQVNSTRFDAGLDVDACMEVGRNGSDYPGNFDSSPNCLHASSTANLHFHGTHTNPDGTGDNVYLQVRPLPRDLNGVPTTTPLEVTEGFDAFFDYCTTQLQDAGQIWPRRWHDLPQTWVRKQTELLTAYQQANPSQPLWDLNRALIDVGWPQYYIGAVPYCFALPEYTEATWPPPPGSASPVMGQAPGTHWYHAHKHGSTALNVASGMTGALIIEGKYDDDLNDAYSEYVLGARGNWNTRQQPTMVINQLSTNLPLLGGFTVPRPEFTVNGQSAPTVRMVPGEIQLWRIVNTSGRSAAYFMAPEDGLQWRQLSQDGIQLHDQNYQASENKPFYLAPGNRVDLLVRAPTEPMTTDILVQDVMARSIVRPTPANPTEADPKPGAPLLRVTVSGEQVTRNGQPDAMQFLSAAPEMPSFLVDIRDDDSMLAASNYRGAKLIFHSQPPRSVGQHTINGVQFENGAANVSVRLGSTEEWTIVNTTPGQVQGGSPSRAPGAIDHPFHIHVNPFQVTEVFDPNEYLKDPTTGRLEGRLNSVNRTEPIPKYVFGEDERTDPRQCVLDVDNPRTWEPCTAPGGSNVVWWDVFAIPSGRVASNSAGDTVTVPGYFKMRSRFVDYPGTYVLHCHILVHEDRGMMFSVQVQMPESLPVTHD